MTMTSRLALATAFLAMTPTVSFAQIATDEEASVQDTIIVVGTRGSLDAALDRKRNSTGFVDAIVAEDISQFPDTNIAEALQRVAGVTINRQQGEGTEIVLRGFTPEFSRVEVNGLTALGTGASRNFNFSVFSSELFNVAEVRKTSSSDRTEGGLAGTVNLVTAKPLDFDTDENIFSVRADAIYSELAESTNPRAAISVGRNWNDKFGIAATVAYSQTSLDSNEYSVTAWDFARDSIVDSAEAGLSEEVLDAWIPRVPIRFDYDWERERIGGALDIQAAPIDGVELTWSTIYSDTARVGIQNRADLFELEGGLGAPTDFTLDSGRLIAATFTNAQPRTYTQDRDFADEFFQSSFQGEFDISDNLKLDTQLGYVKSTSSYFDEWSSYGVFGTASYQLEGNFITGTFVPDNNQDGTPDNDGSAIDLSDPSSYPNFRFWRRHDVQQENTELSLAGSLTYEFDNNTFFKSAAGGIRYAEQVNDLNFLRITNRDLTVANQSPGGLQGNLDVASIIPFSIDGQPTSYPSTIIQVDNDLARTAFIDGADPIPPLDRLRSYEVSEDTLAVFAKVDFETNRMVGDIGVRYVTTDLTSEGTRTILNAETEVSIENSYDEILPSATARFSLTDEVIIRGHVGKTLNRPQLGDVSPQANIDIGNNVGNAGNPELDPFTAWNFDLGVEWYFGEEGLISITGFYKDIGSIVETLTEDVTLQLPPTTGGPLQPTVISLQRPINGDSATVQGIEATIQTPFTFLPAPFDGFGGVFNYTFADSEATFANEEDIRTVTLPGLSKNSFNAILYFQNERIDTRLAYTWRDQYLDQTFASGGNPSFRDSFGQLDYSLDYNIRENLTLRFEALNLTQEQVIGFTADRKDLPSDVIDNERIFSLGIQYKY